MKKLLNILFWSVISAAFIGPGTVATCIKAGATHQSQLIWTLVFATISCIILQEAAARISIASGHNLGKAIAQRFDWGGKEKWLIWGLFIAVALGCAAYESGNILGAVAGIQLFRAISPEWITIGIVSCATLLLWKGNFKLIANLLGGIVALMGLTFILLAFQLDIEWGTVVTDIFIPKIFTKNQNKTNFIIDSAKKFNEEIFNEDKEICESIHQNLQNGNKYSNIGKFEQRINFFRKKLIDNKIE